MTEVRSPVRGKNGGREQLGREEEEEEGGGRREEGIGGREGRCLTLLIVVTHDAQVNGMSLERNARQWTHGHMTSHRMVT